MFSVHLKGTATDFRKNFEIPILKGRDAIASEKEVARATEKLQEVSLVTV